MNLPTAKIRLEVRRLDRVPGGDGDALLARFDVSQSIESRHARGGLAPPSADEAADPQHARRRVDAPTAARRRARGHGAAAARGRGRASAAERAESSALEFYLVASASFAAEPARASSRRPTRACSGRCRATRQPARSRRRRIARPARGQRAARHLAHRLGVRSGSRARRCRRRARPLPPRAAPAGDAAAARGLSGVGGGNASVSRGRRELGARAAPSHARVRAARRRAAGWLPPGPRAPAGAARAPRRRRPPRCSARCLPRGASSTRGETRFVPPADRRPPRRRSPRFNASWAAAAMPRGHRGDDDAAPACRRRRRRAAPEGAAAIATCSRGFVLMVGPAVRDAGRAHTTRRGVSARPERRASRLAPPRRR